jgi:hydrogenase maturation protein HypF
MRWIHIHIEGVVQGVGFRPFVFKLATDFNLKGWVCNGVDGVHLEAGGQEEQITEFIEQLKHQAPEESYITSFMVDEINELEVSDFQIVDSNPLGTPNLLITPDLGLCNACREEVHNPSDKRYQYPFITCTHCGPRYSILKSLPYDRHTTSMESFSMCPACEKEYRDPFNRRHFSQTNSCPDCSIPLRLVDNKEKELTRDWNEALSIVLKSLEAGETIAVKGIGGYLLMTDATNIAAIKKLRKSKHRPSKPFALMYPDLETLMKDAEMTQVEADAFQSIQNPVVLVKVRAKLESGICLHEVAPGLQQIGAMLPYAGMFELLMKKWGKPIIATSGNVSGSPIIYEDHSATEELKPVASLFLIHDREIQIAEDDSVVRFSEHHRMIIRRSRGFAPTFYNHDYVPGSACVLAMGADMKSAFSLQANGRVYISQYLGDLETYDSQQYFRHTVDHLLSLVRAKPQQIIIDAHPNYFSSKLGRQLAELWQIPVEEVFHHKAHAWSVLAENNLLESKEPVLCVVWDGTGYGEDHQSWGGEFFTYENHSLKRNTHLSYFPVWQGDAMAREPRLSALFLCRDFLKDTTLRNKFSDTEWSYYLKLIQTKPTLYTSSIGRLFDAVAAMLNMCDYNTYEGEAAMLLEAKATAGKCLSRYQVIWKNNIFDAESLMKQIIIDLDHQVPIERIAFKFHGWLADIIFEAGARMRIKNIALSGGVFQNALLINLIDEKMNADHKVFLNKELSANDENISLGQLAYTSVKRKQEQEVLAEKLVLTT